MLYDLTRLARLEYRKSGQRLRVPERKHISSPGYVRLSSLGDCPLKAAYQKHNIAVDLPDFDPNESIELADILDGGTYKAEMYQEPLLWWATHQVGFACEVERDTIDHELKVTGRMDAYLRWIEDGVVQSAIVEMKYSSGSAKDTPAEPRINYCLQLLAYAMLMGYETAEVKPRLFLLTIGKRGFRTWELKPQDAGFIIYDNMENEVWVQPKWGTQFNSPTILNFDTVRAEITRQHQFLAMVDADKTKRYDPPIVDPLTDERGWACVETKSPTKTLPGWVRPNCGYCPRCHGIAGEERVIEVDGVLVRDAGF